jgi:hypothetical protein
MYNLVNAKKAAIERSLLSKKNVYIDQKGEECELKDHKSNLTLFAFNNGHEVPFDPLPYSTQVQTAKVKVTEASLTKSKNKKMETVTTEEKVAKKAPAKKTAKPAAKKASKAPVKKESKPSNLVGKATTLLLSPADWKRVDKAVADGKGSIRDLVAKGILKVI